MMIHHVCIQTNDYQASLDFYTNALGFTLVKESAGFHNRAYNAWIDLNGFFIELQTGKGDQALDAYEKTREGIVHFCFYVEDLRWAYQQIVDAGHSNFKRKDGKAIYRVEDGFLFKVIAPEGTEIEFRDSMI